MHTIDLEPFQYSGTNLTGFRLVSPDDPVVKQVTGRFKEMYLEKNNENDAASQEEESENEANEGFDSSNEDKTPIGLRAETLLLESALTYDAVMLFSQVMSQHPGVGTHKLSCNDPSSIFGNGTSIFNSMKTTTFKGLSGDVQFDQHGNRENFQLEVLELASDGLKVIGTWNATKGIQTNKGKTIEASLTDPSSLRNKTLIVLINIVSSEDLSLRDNLSLIPF